MSSIDQLFHTYFICNGKQRASGNNKTSSKSIQHFDFILLLLLLLFWGFENNNC